MNPAMCAVPVGERVASQSASASASLNGICMAKMRENDSRAARGKPGVVKSA